ncbi:Uncharacterized protein APZ42_017093 [Daphnia magna]|uniref:Uncharacterized protein n=1 Tax=Daphnia magna TaxID=35525 RepID=A0A165A157_9CRUS|nr:Uncharacterized protein APZ42_017093 [Daphnia magna]
MVLFISAALQCAKIDREKNLLIMPICTMPASLSNLEMTYEQTTQY